MTHAERVREAERAVVEAAVSTKRLTWEAKKLLALRAATCPECGGHGEVGTPSRDYPDSMCWGDCPAGCEAGKRRDGA